MRILVALLITFCLLPAAAGQSQPSLDNSTFYGQVDCDSSTYGLSTVKESVGTNCGSAAGTSMTWTMPETRAAESTLLFEEGGEVSMTIWIGSGTHVGDVEVTSTVLAGDVEVAQASGSVTFVGAVGGYEELTLTTTVAVLEAVGPLTWIVEASGPFSSVFLRFEEGRWTQFTLPIVGVEGLDQETEASVAFENLTAPPLLDLAFDQSTTAVFVYNWTSAEEVLATWNVTGNGSVVAKIMDDAGATLLNETILGAGNASLLGFNGSWSLELALDSFVGTIQFEVTEEAEPVDDPTEEMGNSTQEESLEDEPEEKESPGLGALLIGLTVLGLAIRTRRS